MTSVIGPQVAFVDDIESEITPIKIEINRLDASTIFFNAKPEETKFPPQPYDTVKILFLDLYYKRDFDAEISAQWVKTIIPKNSEYTLVIWSKDTHHTTELLEMLNRLDLKPTHVEAWQKTNFNLHTHNFNKDINRLINTISSEKINEEIIYGEVLEIEEDGLLVNCLLDVDNPAYQVRRFDNELFGKVEKKEVGTFVRICIYTKSGSRLINIFEEQSDMSAAFKRLDFFKGLEGNTFFIED
ncbi:hypothetical protein [Flavihumibacter petaseus]|uniref:Uncharacterized protein n=1 Tax=Flavihumibacter petaseus NBRC 106054 TaxID=1220578 RepID=A0A0E9N272_9BACT|nr:hypothetical protein [Flavihumibacter petaseus]GAO44132.1 hypothetical protein FPE01S_03_01710 [Flavihumibacter petaseus NBRC 106054]